MKKLVCILALGAAFAANNALAWGNDGHRIVGAIADRLIQGSNAEKQVAALLQQGESLAGVASWADCVKGTYCGPQTPEMVAYTTANPKHSEYHYTDVPFQLPAYHDHGVGTAEEDVVQTLKQAILVLQGKDTAATNPHRFSKRQALLLLTHLAGDIHQPLHVGAAFVGKDGGFVVPHKQSDIDSLAVFDSRGGNNLLLDDATLLANSEKLIPPAAPKEGADAKPANGAAKAPTKPLHSYWDTTVVDYAMRRVGTRTPEQFAHWAIASKPAVAVNSGDPVTWPYQWADDALAVSKLSYADVKVGVSSKQTSRSGESYTVWSLVVPDNYPVPSSAIAREQLIKGGYHLAAVLQAIWP
ncbi:S1/P1 nuclease [Massilia sp. NR 4-1]|uniref:S1/P1 nuclease n=1 Tax=Massilia sp. NR 4-1 TaxID=1678028 RepID=UPI00067B7338|nr:S1/P1 nuclease [Massilia sp. NR 4-1]AKU22382.1 phospholipase [Massilia sp. NR 4-1]